MLFSVTVKVKMGLQSHQTLLAANPLKLPLNRNQLERRERMHRQPLAETAATCLVYPKRRDWHV